MTLGERLKELRKERGWTLRDVEQRTSVSFSYVSDLERDRTYPSLETLIRIAGVYNMTVVNILLPVDLGEKLEAIPFDEPLPFQG